MIEVKAYNNDIEVFGGNIFYVASSSKMDIRASGSTKTQALKNLRDEIRKVNRE